MASIFRLGSVLATSVAALPTLRTRLDKSALRDAASGFFTELRKGDLEGVLAVCIEGGPGAVLLREEEERVFKNAELETLGASIDEAKAQRLAALERFRDRLTAEGLIWERAAPIAFGGIRAHVFDSEQMKEPVETLLGNIYVADGTGVYAIEVSFRSWEKAYYLSDIWDVARVKIDRDETRKHSMQFQKDLEVEIRKNPSDVQFSNLKHVYVEM